MTMAGGSIVKRLVRRAVSSAAYFGGYCYYLGIVRASRAVRIICYHSICNRPAHPLAVSTSEFARQMRLLAECHTVLSMDQAAGLIRRQRPIPDGAVAVTIDDGYSDVYTCAYPILMRYAIPATVFLPVEFINNAGSVGAARKLPNGNFLTWDQVREMSRHGLAFGSHTLTHESLTRLTRAEAQRQLTASKARLEAELGRPVSGFAYPYGTYRDHDAVTEQLVVAARYSWAVTSISKANDGRANLFALGRAVVEMDDSLESFERMLKGALDPWIVLQWAGQFGAR
jgi:peptidoglycan/xylan/chitin deacetylase (PgdA/CDA1 family)